MYRAQGKTAVSFRLNSEFSFKEQFETPKDKEKKFNQTSGNFHLKLKIPRQSEGINLVVNKYSTLKESNEKLSKLKIVNILYDQG